MIVVSAPSAWLFKQAATDPSTFSCEHPVRAALTDVLMLAAERVMCVITLRVCVHAGCVYFFTSFQPLKQHPIFSLCPIIVSQARRGCCFSGEDQRDGTIMKRWYSVVNKQWCFCSNFHWPKHTKHNKTTNILLKEGFCRQHWNETLQGNRKAVRI